MFCILNFGNSGRQEDDYDPYVPPIPFVMVSASYVRRGDNFIPVGCMIMSYDPFWGIWFPDDVDLGLYDWEVDFCAPIEWSDNGAGGEFGYFDAKGNWVPHNGPMTTHYRTACWDEESGSYVPIKPQIVRISVCVDDSVDGHLADDLPQWSSPENDGYFTVWEFWITPCPYNWRPILDDSLTFTAYIRPVKDHLGQSMARIIKFFLESSFEPGYCLNATREVEAWNDTRGYDLKFPDQPGFSIGGLDRNIATTVYAMTDATVQVVCLDYGAYGAISAIAEIAGELVSARLEGTMDKREAQIPVDEDNNHIADSWAFNHFGAATRDDDPTPPARIQGDGLSLYEEYRGFVVKGVWRDLNPSLKDVFIVNLLDELYHPNVGLDLGYFPKLGTVNHLIWHTEHRGYVNFNHGTAHLYDVACIVLIDGGDNPEGIWGETFGFLPFPTECVIYTQTIRKTVPPNFDPYTWDDVDILVAKNTIAHELGHAVHCRDHYTGTEPNCVMFQPTTPEEEFKWYLNIPNDYCNTNPGCRNLWYLRPP